MSVYTAPLWAASIFVQYLKKGFEHWVEFLVQSCPQTKISWWERSGFKTVKPSKRSPIQTALLSREDKTMACFHYMKTSPVMFLLQSAALIGCKGCCRDKLTLWKTKTPGIFNFKWKQTPLSSTFNKFGHKFHCLIKAMLWPNFNNQW